MKLRIAILAACAGALVLPLTATVTFATNDPIPGVDIIVRKNPGGTRITVGSCRSGGGKIVKKGNEWVCTGFPATASPKRGANLPARSGDAKSPKKNGAQNKMKSGASPGNTKPGMAVLRPAEFKNQK